MTNNTIHLINNQIEQKKLKLKSSQPNLCIPIIERIVNKIHLGIKFEPIKTNNQIICDGHHRYIATILTNSKIHEIPGSIATQATHFQWENVNFDLQDWENDEQIQLYNEADAIYNEIPIEKLLELIKKKLISHNDFIFRHRWRDGPCLKLEKTCIIK